MMKYLLQIMIFILLIGCGHAANEKYIPLSIDESYDNIGVFSQGQKSYIYAGKRAFNPRVDIFNHEGKEEYSVSLNQAEQKLGNITNIWVHSLDSIFVYSYFKNTLVILNSKGSLTATKNLEGKEDENGNLYEFYAPYGNIEKADNIIFTSCLLPQKSAREHGSWQSFSEYCQKMKDGYLLFNAEISRHNDSTRYALKVRNLQNFLEKDSILFFPFWQVTFVNNKYLFNSKYSRYIYHLNEDLTLKNQIQIIPDSICPMKPVKVDGTFGQSEEVPILLSPENQKGCYINRIFYDKRKDDYIFILTEYDVDLQRNIPCFLLVYNADFEKIKEVKIKNKHMYDGANCFFIHSKVYIEKIKADDAIDKRVFEAFKI